MRKAGTFLCGIMAAVLITGCGSVMPDLTEEETELISEYASGVLLKYDRVHSGRLMSTSEYEEEENKKAEREQKLLEEKRAEEENTSESDAANDTENDTEVVDVSQDEETASLPATIEEFYGIQNVTFQYAGYELVQSYPAEEEEGTLFFSMDATEGMELLVLKFTASNGSSADQALDMMGYGARFRISVNGGSQENALSTMLLNDLHTYNDVIPAGSSVELVSIIEVPQSTAVESINFILCGDAGNSTIVLQ